MLTGQGLPRLISVVERARGTAVPRRALGSVRRSASSTKTSTEFFFHRA